MRLPHLSLFLVSSLLVACGDDDGSTLDLGPSPTDMMVATDMEAPLDMFQPQDAGADLGPTVRCEDAVADDTIETAQDLGDIQSADGFPVGSVEGDIDPITDFDWYAFHVEDVLTGDVQPRYSLSARPAGVVWELCMYFACDSGDTSFDCPTGTTAHMAGDIPGCCAVSTEGTPSISLEPACSGTLSEDGTAYARISRQAGAVTCEGYTLTYGDE